MAPRPPVPFPRVAARDLTGRDVLLPEPFDGARNVVIVAFKRGQQERVDSWVPWLEERADQDPGLRFFEVPSISDRWSPARRAIDGGMAAAIRDEVVLRRTLTVYGDLRRLTDALEMDDRETIWVLVVDAAGVVRWSTTGAFDPVKADGLGAALDAVGDRPDAGDLAGAATIYDFAFDRRFRLPLALLGVTPGHAHVTVTADRFVARFGPWSLETGLDNVAGTCVTTDYRWFRAIGARGSFADRGLTFGTNTEAGVCVRFVEPVPGLEPFGVLRHPAITVTVADSEGLAALLRTRAGPPASTA